MNYTVETSPNIGSDMASNIGNGRHGVHVGNLTHSTTYTWTVNVTDDTHWTNQTYTFTTDPLTSWFDTNWKYRKAIVIDHTKVTADLSNFPVLIDVTDSDVASKAKPNGDDIIFVESQGSKLHHEIELYENGTGHLVAWVNVPLLSSTSDTKLYLYYGNPNATSQENSSAVWDSDFVMVQHMEESAETLYDSTSNGNDGTVYGDVGGESAGMIDGAGAFDANGYIKVPEGFLPNSSITLELWLKPSSSSPTVWTKFVNTGPETTKGISGGQASKTTDLWYLTLTWDSKTKKFKTGQFASGYTWNHLAITWDGEYCYAYLNGEEIQDDQITGSPDWADKPLYLGSNLRGRELFDGFLDEIRVSNISRSTDWIHTGYVNQENPTAFCTVKSEENYSEGQPPALFDEEPGNGTTEVYSNPTLSIHAIDIEGDLMNITFSENSTGTWKNIKTYFNVGDGIYSVIPAEMKNLGTKYFWTVSATDDRSWTNKTYTFTTTSTVLQYKWTKTGLGKGKSGVLVADVTGNAMEEVIYACKGQIVVLNGTNKDTIWAVSDSNIASFVQPQGADLNGDGILEILVPLLRPAGLLVLHGNNGTTYWRRDTGLGFETWSSPVIADIDGDGIPTIFFASSDVHNGSDGTGRVTSLSYDGQILHQTFAWRPCSGGLAIADTDGDGEFELYVTDRSSGLGKGTIAFWAKNLTQRWYRKDMHGNSATPILGDVNKDGILDVIVGTPSGGVAVFRSHDGSTIK